jgi:hypothetical protein
LFISIKISLKENNLLLALTLPITFLLIHLSYGWGYLTGILKYHILRQKAAKVALSR